MLTQAYWTDRLRNGAASADERERGAGALAAVAKIRRPLANLSLMSAIPADHTGIVQFTAEWCGPCQMIKPLLKKLVQEHSLPDVLEVNVDDHGETAEAFGVTSIPDILFLAEGVETARVVGASEAQLREAAAALAPRAAAVLAQKKAQKKAAASQIALPTCEDASVSCQPAKRVPSDRR